MGAFGVPFDPKLHYKFVPKIDLQMGAFSGPFNPKLDPSLPTAIPNYALQF